MCEFCLKNQFVHTMPDGYKVCEDCKSKVQQYYVCRVCNKKVTADQSRHARKEFVKPICCSNECYRKEDIACGRLCCDQAETINCVCFRSYKCAVHHPNGVHVGTHD
jgi:hypothetical protein